MKILSVSGKSPPVQDPGKFNISHVPLRGGYQLQVTLWVITRSFANLYFCHHGALGFYPHFLRKERWKQELKHMIRQKICKEENHGKSGFRNSASEESLILFFFSLLAGIQWTDRSFFSSCLNMLNTWLEIKGYENIGCSDVSTNKEKNGISLIFSRAFYWTTTLKLILKIIKIILTKLTHILVFTDVHTP